MPASGRVIDGWELGDVVDCEVVDGCDRCSEYLDVAVDALRERVPGHLPIIEKRLYNMTQLVVRSGGPILVAVLQLADGSVHAIGVGRIGIGGLVPFDAPDRPWDPGGTAPESGPCGPRVVDRRPW